MALTVGQAISVNRLIDWILTGKESVGLNGVGISDDEARSVCMMLANQANKTLSAGHNGQRVHALWVSRRFRADGSVRPGPQSQEPQS